MPLSESDIVEVIREFVAMHAGRPLDEVPAYSKDYDLFENGDLDSFGFVELLSLLGDRTGRFLDLSDVDPADLAIVGTLTEYYAAGGSG